MTKYPFTPVSCFRHRFCHSQRLRIQDTLLSCAICSYIQFLFLHIFPWDLNTFLEQILYRVYIFTYQNDALWNSCGIDFMYVNLSLALFVNICQHVSKGNRYLQFSFITFQVGIFYYTGMHMCVYCACVCVCKYLHVCVCMYACMFWLSHFVRMKVPQPLKYNDLNWRLRN